MRVARHAPLTLLALVGLVLLAGGIAGALWFGAAPRHVRQVVERPVLRRTGDFDMTLVPTGATNRVAVTRVCVPVRGVLWPACEDAACQDVDSHGLRRAGLSIAAFIVGAVAWVASDAEPRLRRALAR
jgi:hypothetical protein